MRYRRFSYRYAVVFSRTSPQPIGEILQFERSPVQLAQTWWRPAADVYETPTAIVVTAELAGVDPEKLDILLYEDAVVVEGERRLSAGETGGVYHAAEIRQGPFRLEVTLPAPVDSEDVTASYDQGLLRMTFPKLTRG